MVESKFCELLSVSLSAIMVSFVAHYPGSSSLLVLCIPASGHITSVSIPSGLFLQPS